MHFNLNYIIPVYTQMSLFSSVAGLRTLRVLVSRWFKLVYIGLSRRRTGKRALSWNWL